MYSVHVRQLSRNPTNPASLNIGQKPPLNPRVDPPRIRRADWIERDRNWENCLAGSPGAGRQRPDPNTAHRGRNHKFKVPAKEKNDLLGILGPMKYRSSANKSPAALPGARQRAG